MRLAVGRGCIIGRSAPALPGTRSRTVARTRRASRRCTATAARVVVGVPRAGGEHQQDRSGVVRARPDDDTRVGSLVARGRDGVEADRQPSLAIVEGDGPPAAALARAGGRVVRLGRERSPRTRPRVPPPSRVTRMSALPASVEIGVALRLPMRRRAASSTPRASAESSEGGAAVIDAASGRLPGCNPVPP